MKFSAILSSFSDNNLGWDFHLAIPNDIYIKMLDIAKDKRVRVTMNENVEHYCAMMPKGEIHYILLNKDIVKKLGVRIGDNINVVIEKALLQYGIPICQEFEDVLAFDDEGSRYFHLLTAGTQRSLIHIINKYKNPQLRIDRSVLLLRHLTLREGALDFKILQQNFREGI